MLILGIVLGTVAYLQVGYHVVGKHSWRVWQKRKSNGTLPFLLFPFSSSDNSVGKSSAPFIDDCKTEREYALTLAFIWPVKLVSNVVVLSGIGAFAAMVGIFSGAVWLGIDAPGALWRKLAAIRAPKKPPSIYAGTDGIPKAIEREIDEAIDTERKFARLEAREKEKPAD